MRTICARFYLFLQCAIYAQDCTYFSNAQYIVTTLAGGFLVTNYHDAGRKVSKSNLDPGRKQKRLLRQTAVDTWRG